MVRKAEHGHRWYIGAIASKVAKSNTYGEGKLMQLAAEADIDDSTLRDYRWTFERYKDLLLAEHVVRTAVQMQL